MALAEYLGRQDPGFTLRTYAHLMQDSDVQAQDVIDAALHRNEPNGPDDRTDTEPAP
jgi:hypothetical protein